MCVIHQGVDGKHDECDLKKSKPFASDKEKNGSRMTGPFLKIPEPI